MKILFDACVPRPLRKELKGHTILTAQEMGWGALQNGALLKEAEKEFEGFVTTDHNMRYQQKIAGRKLGILVLPTNDWTIIRGKASEIGRALSTLKAGDFIELDWE